MQKSTYKVLGIWGYNKDILLLVIPTMAYSEKVPFMVGSKIIDRAMGMIMKGELVKATVTWKQVLFGTVISWVTPVNTIIVLYN